jgi:hypothetical protein
VQPKTQSPELGRAWKSPSDTRPSHEASCAASRAPSMAKFS